MARFTRYNNPNRKNKRKKYSQAEADIMACNLMLADKKLGYNLPIEYYEEHSKRLQGKENIL